MSKRFLTALVCTLLSTSAATAATVRHRCALTEVAVWQSRIHVQCASGPIGHSSIIFFAVPTETAIHGIPNPAANANRFLQVALAALSHPEAPLWLEYDIEDLTGLQYGCHDSNCRTARVILLDSPSSAP